MELVAKKIKMSEMRKSQDKINSSIFISEEKKCKM